MTKIWDALMKMLVRANPQDFVSFLTQETYYEGDVTNELLIRSVDADFLCQATKNAQDIIVHAEYQRRDKNMARRLWEYNVATSFLTKLPVLSFAIYLWKEKNIATSPYTEDDKQWLKRRFAMFHEVLEDSWSYQEMVQKGIDVDLQKGLDQGLQTGLDRGLQKGLQAGFEQGELTAARSFLARLIEKHFLPLLPLAQQKAAQLKTVDALNTTIDKLLKAQMLEQAREVLEESTQ